MTGSNALAKGRFLIAAAVSVLLVVAVVLAAAVWRARGDDGSSTVVAIRSATAVPSPSTITAEQEAITKALAAYSGYWETYVKASETSDAYNDDLSRYLADPLLTEVRLELRTNKEYGIIHTGRPVSNPRATTVNISGSPKTVGIEDCFDNAGWIPLYEATGKSAAAPNQVRRYIVTSTASYYTSRGGWLISESRADRSRPC